MPLTLTIEQGDSTTRIAGQYGHFANTIWNDPANAELKQKRLHMDILMPGDELVVPDIQTKTLQKQSDVRHQFRRKGVPAKFRLRLFVADHPRAHQAYRFVVDGKLTKGQTDAHGLLEEYVPTGAEEGILILDPHGERYRIAFGWLDPVSEMSGIQQRLNNLGFDCGEPDGQFGERTSAALAQFQLSVGLEATGKADAATKAKLKDAHDADHTEPVARVEQAKSQ